MLPVRSLFFVRAWMFFTQETVSLLSPVRCYSSRKALTPRSTLYSKVVRLRDPRASVVPHLEEWAVKGKVLPEDVGFVIRELRRRNRRCQALEVSEWMDKKGIKFSPKDHAVHLDLIGVVHGLVPAEMYFNSLEEENKTEKTYGALLFCYVRERLVEKSLSHMKKMKDLGFAFNALAYNDIMCLYTNTGQHEKVPTVFLEMKEDQVLPNNFSYRICINSYGYLSEINKVEELLAEMEQQSHIIMDWNTYASVASIYIKLGVADKALSALRKSEERMNKKSNICFDHLISLYGHLKNKNDVLRLWQMLKLNSKLQTDKDYATVIWALSKTDELEQAEILLKEWESSGGLFDFHVPNVLLVEYCAKGLAEKAETILKDYVKKGRVPPANSWSILAKGFAKKHEFNKAYECMKKAFDAYSLNSGWEPNPRLVAKIFQGVNNDSDINSRDNF